MVDAGELAHKVQIAPARAVEREVLGLGRRHTALEPALIGPAAFAPVGDLQVGWAWPRRGVGPFADRQQYV